MIKEMPKWKERSKYEKGLLILSMTLALLVILFATMSLAGMWQDADKMIQPLMGFVMVIQALIFWKYNKPVAIFSLIVSLFVLVTFMVVAFFR